MNALAHNVTAQTPVYHSSWKLAVCASLALVITLLSARLINHSVVLASTQAVQPTPAVQLSSPLAPTSTAPVLATRWNRI
jgi:P pilus assembly chaperone PapD